MKTTVLATSALFLLQLSSLNGVLAQETFTPPTATGGGKCFKKNRPPPPPTPPVQPSQPAQPNQPAQPRSSSSSVDSNSCMAKHNYYRAQKGLPALLWDAGIAAGAQSWANQKRGVMQHSSGTGNGENLYMGGGGCDSAVADWMSEGGSSMPNLQVTSGNYMSIGHYSQVMWKGTSKLGCGEAYGLVVCRYVSLYLSILHVDLVSNSYLYLSRYYPPGNMLNSKMW